MLKEKIENQIIKINSLAGKVDKNSWDNLRAVTAELKDAAKIAGNYESKLIVPETGNGAIESSPV